jgi:hypothetical protein
MVTKLKSAESAIINQSPGEKNLLLSYFSAADGTDHDETIENFFKKLKNLKQHRSNLKQFNELIDNQTKLYRPLVKQVCENLIKSHQSSNQTQVPGEQLVDIEHRVGSTSATDGIKEIFKQFKFGFVYSFS